MQVDVEKVVEGGYMVKQSSFVPPFSQVHYCRNVASVTECITVMLDEEAKRMKEISEVKE